MVANVPSGINDSAKTIAAVIKHAVSKSYSQVEVDKTAQDEWVELCMSGPARTRDPDCTPGYYNNEGMPDDRSLTFVGYPGGPYGFFQYIEDWRTSGSFD